MIRKDFENLPTGQWTHDEAAAHLERTFSHAATYWPDVMDGYVALLADEADHVQRTQIMRRALRETTQIRYGSMA